METQAAAPPHAPITADIPPPPAVAPLSEPLPTKLERLHAEALDALRLVMTKALDSITTLPPPTVSDTDTDEPAQSPADHARTVTQRMRLALTAARDLLRYTHGDGSESPSPSSAGDRAFRSNAHERRKSSSDAQHHSNSSSEGRMRIPSGTPEATEDSASATPTSAPAPDSASQLLGAAGAEVRRCGEGGRIAPPHDSQLSTQDSPPPVVISLTPPLPLSPSSSPRLTPTYPRVPDRPNWGCKGPVTVPAHFTDQEIDLFEATLRTSGPFPKPLYRRLKEWRRHCIHYYLEHPLPVTSELLAERNPFAAPKDNSE